MSVSTSTLLPQISNHSKSCVLVLSETQWGCQGVMSHFTCRQTKTDLKTPRSPTISSTIPAGNPNDQSVSSGQFGRPGSLIAPHVRESLLRRNRPVLRTVSSQARSLGLSPKLTQSRTNNIWREKYVSNMKIFWMCFSLVQTKWSACLCELVAQDEML